MPTPSTEEYRTITLTRGQVALVDLADYETLSQWKWWTSGRAGCLYAARHIYLENGSLRVILMHRQLLGLEYGDKRLGDHRNMNGLDNRRANLRIATKSQNGLNRRAQSNSKSRIKGVSWKPDKAAWRSRICVGGVEMHLGYFPSREKAGEAYWGAAQQLHGEFARKD